jgi:hypothetical protein
MNARSVIFLWMAAVPAARAALWVALDSPSQDPPAVGDVVFVDATSGDASGSDVWYRFRVRRPDGTFQTIMDYGPSNSLEWTASRSEGTYEIEVTARDLATGETATTSTIYQIAPRIVGDEPGVSATANGLVFLYSAPPCAAGRRMAVVFESQFGSTTTPFKDCVPGSTMNFYLAGLKAGTSYKAHHTFQSEPASNDGPTVTFETDPMDLPIVGYTVKEAPPVPLQGILLQSTLTELTVATDLYGNPVWFYPHELTSLTRPGNGSMYGIIQDPAADPSYQIVREFDLAGVTLRETNAARINEQLKALGRAPISGFHHEALPLPRERIAVLASTERILTDVQGEGDVDVIGDMILVLDRDLHVVWTWDTFDHLDPHRMATLNETCAVGGGGCPPFYLAEIANDWTHGNALQLTADGNLLYSCRHQDWLIKIDYRQGDGTGDILWRMGKDGDFTMDSTDPYPWFSHQHDPGFLAGDQTLLAVFDNGNVRHGQDPTANSRGQVLRVNEDQRTVSLVLNADLGAYSLALGSAQQLPNGNYHFELGWIMPGTTSRAVEVDPQGQIVYAMDAATLIYRSFRLPDLYAK